jgi:hypothetical protein
MLDSSNSIDDREWQHFMTFHDKLLNEFPIAEGGMHVGIEQFASRTALVSPLTGVKTDLLQANKDNMHPRGNDTNSLGTNTRMDKAVDAALVQFKMGGRSSVNDVLVMLTDGLPTGGSFPGSMADKAFARAKAAGVQVLFVLIGTVFQWLPLPKSWYSNAPIMINNFAALERARKSVVDLICTTVSKTPSPTEFPTAHFTQFPTRAPTFATFAPITLEPSAVPTWEPTTEEPTEVPTGEPTTEEPTEVPTEVPTHVPTWTPTEEPTPVPSDHPSEVPTTLPPTTDRPSAAPTHAPTEPPTADPTPTPTEEPTREPTPTPTESPTHRPTRTPTRSPTRRLPSRMACWSGGDPHINDFFGRPFDMHHEGTFSAYEQGDFKVQATVEYLGNTRPSWTGGMIVTRNKDIDVQISKGQVLSLAKGKSPTLNDKPVTRNAWLAVGDSKYMCNTVQCWINTPTVTMWIKGGAYPQFNIDLLVKRTGSVYEYAGLKGASGFCGADIDKQYAKSCNDCHSVGSRKFCVCDEYAVSRSNAVRVAGWKQLSRNAGTKEPVRTPADQAKIATAAKACKAAFTKTHSTVNFAESAVQQKFLDNMVSDCALDMVAFPEATNFIADYEVSMCETWREER